MSSPRRSTRSGGAGRIPSCEPCRISKLACDHGRPVCARCARKGTPEQCAYRKDPFKRSSRKTSAPVIAHISPVSPDYIAHASHASHASPQQPLQLTLYPNPGFQGSSSLNTILDTVEHGAASFEEEEAGQRPDTTDAGGPPPVSVSDTPDTVLQTMLVMSGSAMIEEGAQVLDLLTTLYTHGILQQLFEEWMDKGLEIHVGSLLVRPFFDSIGGVFAETEGPEGSLVLSRRLFHAAKASTDVDGAASLQDFADKYTGASLRWETVGLVLALAGNAVSKLRAPHAVYRTEAERSTLGRNLLHASNKCASFCESLDILNDVQIIFLYESFLLHSVYFGHQSFRVWGRLNTAINALFGRGLHQRLDRDKESESSLPFFLVELRKHVFALLYSSDINFSVFLGRPPRISRRHCVIHMPLDVTPAAYGLPDQNTLQTQELQHLDARGWNTLGQIRTHTVIRWSMVTSQIREEALEATLGPADRPDREATIAGLRSKIAAAWAALPPFLAVPARDVWAARRPGQQTDALYLVRLYYLHTIFLIEWTASVNGTANLDPLFVAASDLLAWVNEAIIMRERLNRLGLNTLAWRVSGFGLPAAGALAKCLQAATKRTSSTAPSPATFTRAVRDLSVLAAHMDYLYDSSDGNDKLFSRAKGILMRVLESTLRRREPAVATSAPIADVSPSLLPILSPPSNGSNTFDQWEFRPELWIGLPGPNSTEVSHLDFMSDFTSFLD